MRTLSVFGVVAGLMLAASDAALAAPKCQTTIPKEWNQPRVSYTYSQSWGEGYGARASAQSYATRSSRPTYSSYSSRAYR
ncbi:MAG: hypothetical protein JOZ70_01605 [Pseudolabrys sp.]|nr:hypothetical protein [Pseudolabrys sp.]